MDARARVCSSPGIARYYVCRSHENVLFFRHRRTIRLVTESIIFLSGIKRWFIFCPFTGVDFLWEKSSIVVID